MEIEINHRPVISAEVGEFTMAFEQSGNSVYMHSNKKCVRVFEDDSFKDFAALVAAAAKELSE